MGLVTNGMMYKCPECDMVLLFEVPCDLEYFKQVFEWRGQEPLYYPPLEKFKEDELVKQRLESLGYF